VRVRYFMVAEDVLRRMLCDVLNYRVHNVQRKSEAELLQRTNVQSKKKNKNSEWYDVRTTSRARKSEKQTMNLEKLWGTRRLLKLLDSAPFLHHAYSHQPHAPPKGSSFEKTSAPHPASSHCLHFPFPASISKWPRNTS
jgi:hypothetical protein